MRYKLYVLGILCFLYSNIKAQNNLITLENESSSEGLVMLYANSHASCLYTLKIILNTSGFVNNYGNPYFTTVNQGRSQVCKFIPDNNSGIRTFKYSYTFYAGKNFRNPPTVYKHYLLPISIGKTTLITSVSNLKNFLEKKGESYYYAKGFTYDLGDTIFATRAGIVYNINDEIKQGETSATIYTSNRNIIYIQHKDGTVGHYTMLSPIQSLVKNGENVIPGQPLAIFNTHAEKYTMLFSIYYLDENKIKLENNNDAYTPLPIYFYLNTNTPSTNLVESQKYDAVKAIDIITEELSKRDIKKLGFDN